MGISVVMCTLHIAGSATNENVNNAIISVLKHVNHI